MKGPTVERVARLPCGPVGKAPRSQCRGPGSISGQGTLSHMPQLRLPHAATKILRATAKTWLSQRKRERKSLSGDDGSPEELARGGSDVWTGETV